MEDNSVNSAPVDETAPEQAEGAETEGEEVEGQEGEEGQPTEVKAEPKKEAVKAANKKKFKLKVDGKDFEEEVDLDNEEYLIRQLQLAKAAQKRMSEHSALQKDIGQFLADLKSNPRKILSDPRIGLDVKKFAAEILEEEIQNSQKTPEQLKAEQLERELKDLRDEREKERTEGQKREFERLQKQEMERYDSAMTNALQKSDLPKSPYIVKKMADYMLMGLNQGLDVGPEDVIPLIRQEMQNDLKEMFAVMPEEVIEQLVGKDVFNRVRKKNIAKVKAAPPQPLKAAIKDSGKKTEKEEKAPDKVNFKDFFGF